MNVNERLRKIRKDKNISVYRISEECGISQNQIHKIEKGEAQPKIDTLERILRVLGLTMTEFFSTQTDAYYPNDFEKELLSAARSLDPERAKILLQVAKYMKK